MAHCRYMIRRDMPEVLEIESLSFSLPWQEEDYLRILRNRHCIGRVAEVPHTGEVCGSVLIELGKGRIRVLNLAVHPRYRRRGVGRILIETCLLRHVNSLEGRREFVDVVVREDNLTAQLFFRSLGFRWVETIREQGGDAYRMEYHAAREAVRERV